MRERDPDLWNTASDSPVDETNTVTHSSQQEARPWTADDKDCKWRAMSSFEKLYLGVFPHATQDRLSNYVHVQLVKPPSPKGTAQVDLVRPILGPVTRSTGNCALCVLKCIPIPLHDDGAQKRLLREVAIHRSITLGSSPVEECILPLLSHFTSRSIFGGAPGIFLVLVLPYCRQGTLFDYFALRRASVPASQTGHCETTVDESELRWTIGEVVKALNRCHSRGIVHRDVKAENILLCEGRRKDETNVSQRLLLCDFGLSTWTDDEEHGVEDDGGDSTLCGTWDYLSP